MISALVIAISGARTRKPPPRVATSASAWNASMNAGRQSG
jgi:hypothetical protein